MTDQTSASLNSIDIEKKKQQMEQTCERILKLAKQQGATSAEVGVSQDFGMSVQVRQQDVETVEFNQDGSFGISVYFDQSKGSATTTDTSDSAIEEAVAAACNIARFTSPDPFSGLAPADRMATNLIDLQLDHPDDHTTEDYIDMAMRCEQAGLESDKRVAKSDGVSLSAHRFARVYANSHGFMGSTSSTRYSLSCVLIAENAEGMQRDYWYTLGRQFGHLESPDSVGKKAAERTVAHLGSKPIKTCKAPVMFAPDIARGIFGHFLGGIRGSALYRKASFLVDSLGTTLFPDFITIDERPHLVGGLSSSCFDNEGVATYERDIISQGILKEYILSSYSARKLGMETTGNAGGLHNVFISHGELDFSAMLKELDTGLLVTEVMGQGVNMVTGDYSRGAAGFWVEKGEIQFPVSEVTVAGNLKDMFKNIRTVGSDLDKRASVVCGSTIIDGMTIAGN